MAVPNGGYKVGSESWYWSNPRTLVYVAVDKIKIYANGSWHDAIDDRFVVLKGTKYTFKAFPYPSTASWPTAPGPNPTPSWQLNGNPLNPSGEDTKEITFDTTGYHTLVARCGSYDSNSITVIIPFVHKVVKEGTTNEGPLYVCLDDTVGLEAKPYPSGVSFPAGEPHWSIESQPEGASASLAPCWEETKQLHFEDGEFSTVFGPADPLRTVNHIGDDEIVVDDEYSIGWLCDYKLKDDDANLLPDFPDTSKLNAIFADCYIVCDTDAPGGTNDVAFKRNLGGADTSNSEITNAADRGSAGYEANRYWVVYVLSIFQIGYDRDNDPDSEISGHGITEGYAFQASVIPLETSIDIADEHSDNPATCEQQTVVHEIGHQVLESLAHTTGTIMNAALPVPSSQEKFSDDDIVAIRSKTSSPGY